MCGKSSRLRMSSMRICLVVRLDQEFTCVESQARAASWVRTSTASIILSVRMPSNVPSDSGPIMSSQISLSQVRPRARKRIHRGISVFTRGIVALSR